MQKKEKSKVKKKNFKQYIKKRNYNQIWNKNEKVPKILSTRKLKTGKDSFDDYKFENN